MVSGNSVISGVMVMASGAVSSGGGRGVVINGDEWNDG